MFLENINSLSDIKKLNIKELNALCCEIRKEIISTVNSNGGHLSSNLGSVELIVALCYVFDFPSDKLIFDVGHQSYAYKILTGRLNKFSTIRKKDGLSGFPDYFESEYDAFSVGHAGTSISAGLGYCYSRDKLNKDYYVINLVGDASMFNGENLEALTANDVKPKKFLVLLNDNGMSINKNNNGLYKLISKITVKKNYNNFNNFLSRAIGNSFIGKFLKKIKKFLKRSITLNTVTDNIGLKYVGLFDGHDLKQLINILNNIKENENSTILHVKTKKGKGLTEAENDASKFHGIGKNFKDSNHYFAGNVSDILEEIIQKEDKITAITAGMKDGVGLKDFAEKYPNSFVDVGIAEEYAVTLSAGMAISGIKPIVFMYSTFLQRSYDQIIHDVCLQNLPVIFCIDRAGLVGNDGKTHQGTFDISYLTHIPNLTVISPKDATELKCAIETALSLNSPVAIRYPNGTQEEFATKTQLNSSLKWEVLNAQNSNNVILAVGPRMINLAKKVNEQLENKVTIVNARVIKPLDSDLLLSIKDKNVITLEENVKRGGFGSSVLEFYNENGLNVNVNIFAVDNEFTSHASVNEQLEINGITIDNIIKKLQ